MIATVTADQDAKRHALEASVFAHLTEPQLDGIARLSDLRHVEAGELVCAEGEFSQEAFVIAAGQVAVVASGVELAQFGPGELVGDWALFAGGYRSAAVRALIDVDVVVVDPREIDLLLTAVPAAARQLGPDRA